MPLMRVYAPDVEAIKTSRAPKVEKVQGNLMACND